ncbi:MAG: TPM domain-containing protein [Ferruginibacter sp.]
MGIFSIFQKKKQFFPAEEQSQIVKAIQASEKTTSGEIRVFVESKNPFVNPLNRASEIFFKLKMQNTANRNAVLLYIAMDSRELALFADQGIYEKVGTRYWDDAVINMLAHFRRDDLVKGIEQCIMEIGATLTDKFPYMGAADKNELPDDIVFGK